MAMLCKKCQNAEINFKGISSAFEGKIYINTLKKGFNIFKVFIKSSVWEFMIINC